MDSLKGFYEELLCLKAGWSVSKVKISSRGKEIRIELEHSGKTACCGECGHRSNVYDYAKERQWRHLDTMQCTTVLVAKVPRVSCEEHGVKTSEVSWADKHSRFTLLFETFSIQVLEMAKNISAACKLLRLDWKQAHKIMERAVTRGLSRRSKEDIPWLGMDEKSFRKGHNYISVLNDLEEGRVIDVEEGRSSEVAETLLYKGLSAKQREMVCGVSIDMSAPYLKAIKASLPHADIVHDKFHISQHLGEAVDKTRKQEHKELMKEGHDHLKGMKYAFLRSEENLSDEERKDLTKFGNMELKVAKAWQLKELFKYFWLKFDTRSAKRFFIYWAEEVIASGNKYMLKVADMMAKRIENILTYFDCFITNAVSEGLNSKIQSIKASARGYRSFTNYRTAILFYCGKLKLLPR